MAQERPLIYERMAKVMQELPAIGKNQKNREQGFQFRGIDDIYDAIHGLMAKYQIISTPKIISKDRYEGKTAKGTAFVDSDLTIGYTFWTIDGSSVYAESVGVGRDYADKYASKAMAIAHKYALVQVFCIATNEPDNDPDNSYIEGKADKAPKQQSAKPLIATKADYDAIYTEMTMRDIKDVEWHELTTWLNKGGWSAEEAKIKMEYVKKFDKLPRFGST